MSVSNFIAIRVGQKLPVNYRKMEERAICPQCGATFSIAHAKVLADENLAAGQIKEIQEILAGEHVDDKFKDHLVTYEMD
jgi:hypothetical protein